MAQHEYVCQSCIHKKICPEYHEQTYSCVNHLDEADVEPRAEVDLYKRLNDELEDELAVTYDRLENAKREVTREIFEEIERLLDNHYSCCLPAGAIAHYAYYDGDLGEAIAELKNKYTEETP